MQALVLGSLAVLSFSGAAVLYAAGMKGSDLSPLKANVIRVPPALAFLLAYSIATGGLRFTASPEPLLLLAGSAISAIVVGDTFFLKALKEAPATIVYPVSYSFPVATSVFSYLAFREVPGRGFYAALPLTTASIIAAYWAGSHTGGGRRGVLLSLTVSLAWGLGVTLVSGALAYLPPVEANVARLLILMALSTPLGLRGGWRLEKRLVLVAAGGVLGIGVGPVLFFHTILLVGTAAAALITATSPVLASFLARLLLGEPLSPRHAAAVLLASAAIYVATAFR